MTGTIYLCSIIVVIFSGFFIYIRANSNKRVTLVDWFVIGVSAYGGIGVFLIAFITKDYSSLRFFHSLFGDNNIFPYSIFSIFVIFGVFIATIFFEKERYKKKLKSKTIDYSKTIKRIHILAWILFFIGFLSYWIYAIPYGGFKGLLAYSSYIRTGVAGELGLSNSLAFLKRFGGFCFFSSLLFSGLLFSKKSDKRVNFFTLSGFILSFGFSCFIIYSWEARLALISYLLIFPLGFIFCKKGLGKASLHRSLILVLIPLFLLPVINSFWSKKIESKNISDFFVKELSFPLSSFENRDKIEDYNFFSDVLVSPLYMLPSRVWRGMLNIETASNKNTVNVIGYEKGTYLSQGVSGEVPIDLITFGYFQLGYLGIVIIGFIYGFFLIKLDVWIQSNFTPGVRNMMFSYSVLFFSLLTAIYADPQHIVTRNFHFIIGFLIVKKMISKSIVIYK